MSSSNKSKFKRKISLRELPCHLRELADLLEQGNILFSDEEISLESIQSFKLSFKYKNYIDIVETRITVEPSEEINPKENYRLKTVFIKSEKNKKKPSYKKLKKAMSKQYEYIEDSFSMDRLPDMEIVDSFYENSELMTLFSGKGDDYYEDYIRSVQDFRDAVEDKNIKKAGQALKKIEFIKNECHGRYK